MLFAAFTTNVSAQQEKLVRSAGFTSANAGTASQRQELRSLPADTVSPVTQNGKTIYVYPDPRGNRLYVGNAAQYQRYMQLATKARGSARPITNRAYIGGNSVSVREIYN